MVVHINVGAGDLTVAANLEPACLHVNEEAAAALGVQAKRLVATRDCIDCAYTQLRIAMNDDPAAPEREWVLLGIFHDSLATRNGWRIQLIRDHDRARVNGYGKTFAGTIRSAARHLNERAYRLPLGEPVPETVAHFDDWEDAE